MRRERGQGERVLVVDDEGWLGHLARDPHRRQALRAPAEAAAPVAAMRGLGACLSSLVLALVFGGCTMVALPSTRIDPGPRAMAHICVEAEDGVPDGIVETSWAPIAARYNFDLVEVPVGEKCSGVIRVKHMSADMAAFRLAAFLVIPVPQVMGETNDGEPVGKRHAWAYDRESFVRHELLHVFGCAHFDAAQCEGSILAYKAKRLAWLHAHPEASE